MASGPRHARPLLLVLVGMVIYMFTWGQRETLVFFHSFCACYIQDVRPQRKVVLDLSELALPKIFVPYPIKHAMIYQSKYPGTSLENIPETLAPAGPWFRVHHEYSAVQYMMHRLFHDHRLATNNLTEADLCYPGCTAQPLDMASSQTLRFAVRPKAEAKYKGCKELTIGTETLTSQCSFGVPYWHSIYQPDTLSLYAPWELNTTRTNLLCFVGGLTRGFHRDWVLEELRAVGPSVFEDLTKNTSAEWTLSTPPYTRIWDMYARSVFSWQPEGDTVTRRGFYDSWMMGCIPVISRSAACTYASLYGGTLFAKPRPPLSSIVVVLDDAVMTNGRVMLERLSAMPMTEIERRRRRMARLAPLMQWGWGEHATQVDALVEALAVFAHLQ